MSEKYSQLGTRANWQSHEGFVYVGDVALKMMGDLATATPVKVPEYDYLGTWDQYFDFAREHPGNVSLSLAAHSISSYIPRLSDAGVADRWRFGISRRDKKLAEWHNTFAGGVGEFHFTAHFAPAIASTVAYAFVDEGVLGKQDLDNFTLTDWANIIGTGWFSKLMHQMAYTRNGVYRGYGKKPEDYRDTTLWDKIHHEVGDMPGPDEMFKIEEKAEAADGYSYVTASLTPGMTKALHGQLFKQNERDRSSTGGCPVARYGTTVPNGMINTNPHIRSLMESGHIVIGRTLKDGEHVRLHMEWSPIDISMAVFAQRLEGYERLYGTPRLKPHTRWPCLGVEHKRLPAQDALRHPVGSNV